MNAGIQKLCENWLATQPGLKLAIALSRYSPPLSEMSDAAFDDIDFDDFIKIVAKHELTPAVYRRSTALCGTSFWRIKNRLIRRTTKARIRQSRMIKEMFDVVELLKAENIEHLVLKGAPLTLQLYGDIYWRQSVDIDIALSSERLRQAAELFLAQGWVSYSITDDMQKSAAEYVEFRHHTSFIRNGILLELHTRLHPWRSDMSIGGMLEGIHDEVVINGKACAVPSKNDVLKFLCVHGFRHGFRKMKWLCDISWQFKNAANCQKELDGIAVNDPERFIVEAAIVVAVAFGYLEKACLETKPGFSDKAWKLAECCIRGICQWDYNSKRTYLTRNYWLDAACHYHCISDSLLFVRYILKRLLVDIFRRTADALRTNRNAGTFACKNAGEQR